MRRNMRRKLMLWRWMNVVLLSFIIGSVILLHKNISAVVHFSGNEDFNNTSRLQWTQLFPRPPEFDCTACIEGDEDKIRHALALQSSYKRHIIPDEKFADVTKDCEEYKKQRGYISQVKAAERNFSIAFSILLYKEAEQAERLLLAIYRPQNIYCIHVDGKSPHTLHIAMKSIAKCFPNVFIVSKTEDVVYKGFSRLMADINCMNDLVAKNKLWKYFINLPSQAFPLKTNSELVKILKIYNGANDVEGITGGRSLKNRYVFKHKVVREPKTGRVDLERTEQKNPPPPHNITMVKGSAYGVFSRQFVEFVLRDSRVQDFLKWCEDVDSPDEYFWATLHHQDKYRKFHVPGGYNGDPDTKPWLATYAGWQGVDTCHGKWIRSVCVFGLQDIPRLIARKELFANKFFLDVEPFALSCIEEWLRSKSQSSVPSDLYYYRQLPFIGRRQ